MRPEHHALQTELVDIFQKSLQEYGSPEECLDWWTRSGAIFKARRFIELNAEAAALCRNGRVVTATINDPSFVHIFWLLKLDADTVRSYVELLLDSAITRYFPHTKFWEEYSRAVAVFSGLAVTTGTKPKLVGYEKFWEPYLDFMAGTISTQEFAIRARTSFATRNGQSKSIDWMSLDGDAKKPVKWDFRYASIQSR